MQGAVCDCNIPQQPARQRDRQERSGEVRCTSPSLSPAKLRGFLRHAHLVLRLALLCLALLCLSLSSTSVLPLSRSAFTQSLSLVVHLSLSVQFSLFSFFSTLLSPSCALVVNLSLSVHLFLSLFFFPHPSLPALLHSLLKHFRQSPRVHSRLHPPLTVKVESAGQRSHQGHRASFKSANSVCDTHTVTMDGVFFHHTVVYTEDLPLCPW